MVAIEATAGFEAVVAAALVGAGLPDDLQPTIQRRSERGGWGITSVAAHPGYARTNLIASGPAPAAP
jgi:hypothetical protein